MDSVLTCCYNELGSIPTLSKCFLPSLSGIRWQARNGTQPVVDVIKVTTAVAYGRK